MENTCIKCNECKSIDLFIKGKNTCKLCWSKERKLYYKQNKEKLLTQQKEYQKLNIDKIKQYIDNNKDIINNRNKEYYIQNKTKINQQKTIYHNKKMKTDSLYKLTYNIRRNIGISIKNKGYTKKSRTHEILGCTFEEFKNHIEFKFEDWMTWDNKGLYNGTKNYGWDIDHIIPLSTTKCENDIIKLNHYTNLQPLCSYINRDVKKNNLTN